MVRRAQLQPWPPVCASHLGEPSGRVSPCQPSPRVPGTGCLAATRLLGGARCGGWPRLCVARTVY